MSGLIELGAKDMPKQHRIHVVGAAGSGTTTLGMAVAQHLAMPFVDVDDHYWRHDTAQPFSEKRPSAERVKGIRAAGADQPSWVLSGSLYTWGQVLIPDFTLVAFLQCAPAERLARIQDREERRYGDRIKPGGDMYEHSQAFLAWAARYDEPDQADARTFRRHEEWLATLSCPVLRLDSLEPVPVLLERVLAAIA